MKHYSNNWITYAELTTAPKDMTESLVIESLTEAQGDRGHKVFELSNHLGNVLATVSDKKLGQILGGSIVASYYEAQVQTASDYYPFGWQIPSRKVSNGENYRFGFNGKENDSDYGEQLIQDYGFRIYNPSVGRFLSVDPLTRDYLELTPYQFASNKPVTSIDYLGLSSVSVVEQVKNTEIAPPDDYVFDENGNFVRIDRNDKPNRLVVENSNNGQRQEYLFADPKADPAAIESGEINKLIIVKPETIIDMIANSGAMDEQNRKTPYSFIKEAGLGGRSFDFSYTAIPQTFATEGASKNPLINPSPLLFTVESDGFGTDVLPYVHNHMNFGNYLFGAAGSALGLNSMVLQAGAHYNGLFNSSSNGYDPEFDSPDDQLSIGQGTVFARRYGLSELTRNSNGDVIDSDGNINPKPIMKRQ